MHTIARGLSTSGDPPPSNAHAICVFAATSTSAVDANSPPLGFRHPHVLPNGTKSHIAHVLVTALGDIPPKGFTPILCNGKPTPLQEKAQSGSHIPNLLWLKVASSHNENTPILESYRPNPTSRLSPSSKDARRIIICALALLK